MCECIEKTNPDDSQEYYCPAINSSCDEFKEAFRMVDELQKQLALCAQEKDAEIIRLREEIQRLRSILPSYQTEVRIV